VDEHLACSDLCEENGFTRQAELLRSIAGQGRKAYLVVERGAEYNDEIISPRQFGDPKTVFIDRETADKAAAELNAAWYRHNNILDYCYRLAEVTDLSASELSVKIAAILGRDYELPNNGFPTRARSEGPLISGPSTDEQMHQIADLFTLKFYYVVETEFASSDRRSIDT
jgi:hypothetical protein